MISLSQHKDKNIFAQLFAESNSLWAQFILMPKPFETEFWILQENGKTIGRIGANKSAVYPGYGYIGFFQAQDQKASSLLIEEALKWLKTKNVQEVFGPVCFNTWFPYRFKLPSEDKLQFMWEPANPPEYPGYFLKTGFEICEEYHTDGHDGLEGIVSGTAHSLKKATDRGFTFRYFDEPSLLDKEVPILHRLSMEGFKDNFLFEPIPLELFRQLYVPLAKKADLSYAVFAMNENKKEVGFFFNFIDSEYFVLKTATVSPECRGKGVSNAMLHLAAKKALDKGINKSISALVRSGLQSESYGRKQNQLWKHNYVLYRRKI